jgi:hypothetical protein
MSNWYRKSQDDTSDSPSYSSKEDRQQCIFRGIRFFFDDIGNLYDAEIVDSREMDFYIELMPDNFWDEVAKVVNARLTTFGIIKDSITLDFNGLRINVKNPNDDSATIEKATIIDSDKFLKSLPNSIREAIEEKIEPIIE